MREIFGSADGLLALMAMSVLSRAKKKKI